MQGRFHNQPTLAAELMHGVLHVKIPRFTEARVVSADLTGLEPAEYRADMVIQLFDDASVFGIVMNVQLSADDRKRFVWPAPSGVPEVTDDATACANPELAVLSAMAHERNADTEHVVRIAMAGRIASAALDADRSKEG